MSFRVVGKGYRDGNNFFLKFAIPTVYKNPIVVNAIELRNTMERMSEACPIYERNPQKRFDFTGGTFEEGWTVRRIGMINHTSSQKSLRLEIRNMPAYYMTRSTILDSLINGCSVDILEWRR